ncbi:hypothetical protein ACWC4J_15720, partial [Streptomyces sp. NPDC001356]
MSTTSEPSWTAPFTGLSPRCFGRPVTVSRRESGCGAAGPSVDSTAGRPHAARDNVAAIRGPTSPPPLCPSRA